MLYVRIYISYNILYHIIYIYREREFSKNICYGIYNFILVLHIYCSVKIC